ncbi:hypothetical protein LOK49_LG08G00692 [Camellia lanceoleosa]|uniref:Uncharacterized protein n=1 Tax=Camellia lanceoleosa TaxID=1840588 RepID=A0ACC0GNW3_9ERIC|nr:hypothetical protein LOK49_LG08G00692 [Camellia lanceoleosa]
MPKKGSYGKVKVVVFRHKEIRDVHFMLSEWPNMLKILNRLNGLKVDDCQIIAQPALVFPPEVLRVLWSHPDERQRLETTIWMKTLLYTSMNFLANLRIADPMFVQHVQTPEGSLLDIIRNAYDLLSHCDIKIPKIEGNDKYVDSGPPYLVFLHPALGPLWEVTRQKFHGGSISKGSELQIEVAEFSWRNVQLHGSLKVVAENILGSTRMDENGVEDSSKFIAELEPLITDLEPPFTNLEQLFIDLDPPFVDSLISTRQLFIDLDPPFVDSLISTNFIIALSLSSSS